MTPERHIISIRNRVSGQVRSRWRCQYEYSALRSRALIKDRCLIKFAGEKGRCLREFVMAVFVTDAKVFSAVLGGHYCET